MKSIPFSLRTPLIELRSALSRIGLRTREEYEELTCADGDCGVRLSLRGLNQGQLIRCFVSLDENRLLSSGLELFNDLSLEGQPLVGYGSGRGQVTFEFDWLHPDGAEWEISGRQIEQLIQRLRSMLGPRPSPARRLPHRRLAREFLEGVVACVSAA